MMFESLFGGSWASSRSLIAGLTEISSMLSILSSTFLFRASISVSFALTATTLST